MYLEYMYINMYNHKQISYYNIFMLYTYQIVRLEVWNQEKPERQKKANSSSCKDLRRKHSDVEQEWDFDNPCKHKCGRVWLKSTSAGTRKLCFIDGKADQLMPRMDPMLQSLQNLAYYQNEEFALYNNVYNNLFAFAATGVDNGKEGGYDNFFGICIHI
jgi:hypothetical protein